MNTQETKKAPEIEEFGSPAWIEISRQSLIQNAIKIREAAEGLNVYAVLKANAYGHGAIGVARVLEQQGFTHAAVSSAREAAQLRKAGIGLNLLIFDPVMTLDIAKTLDLGNVSLTISDVNMLPAIEEASKSRKIKTPVQVFVDTGMHREGIPWEKNTEDNNLETLETVNGVDSNSALDLITYIHNSPFLHLDGIYTHLATPTDPDTSFAETQLERFNLLLDQIEASNIPLPEHVHIAEGASLMRFPQMHHQDPKKRIKDVRIGNLFYGLPPGGKEFPYMSFHLKRVFIALKTTLYSVEDIPPEEGVGYGQTSSAFPARKAVISIGSADGYRPSYSLTGQSKVLVGGQEISVFGRESMCVTPIQLPMEGKY